MVVVVAFLVFERLLVLLGIEAYSWLLSDVLVCGWFCVDGGWV